MDYRPLIPPSDPAKLPDFLRQEFRRMQQALSAPQTVLRLTPLHAAPDRIGEGDIIVADGTDFNPGSGKGAYRWSGSAWVFLG